ncbi:hypothetical protein [Bradyrhizobium erythrophlei]|uniref:Uncharacterized protein n=1 Tax=Bradyrhizobium erythrophlei TaxID=1437360 RepID=A0A1M5NH91_9BRAD|nr:hypothetical protein [Bradyrhizobium erythrophlei]SHG88333.1 hypothetical protein SAMN05443248_2977 [Bradyrhizobium erythrophlei]
MAKVFIVQGDHFHVPGRPMTAHATKAGADKVAAGLVNDLFAWIEQPQDAKPETWEADLLRARKARADQMGCDLDQLGDDDGDVWITQLEVDGTPSAAPTFVPTNRHGVKPGFYTRPDIVRLLRLHKMYPERIQFIADMME